jgi:hypothetical protein
VPLEVLAEDTREAAADMDMMEVDGRGAIAMVQNYPELKATDVVLNDVRMEHHMEGERNKRVPPLVNKAPLVEEDGTQQLVVNIEVTSPSNVLFQNTTGEWIVASTKLQRLEALVQIVEVKKEELPKKNINDLARANKVRQALEDENAKLKAQVAKAVKYQRCLSIEVR